MPWTAHVAAESIPGAAIEWSEALGLPRRRAGGRAMARDMCGSPNHSWEFARPSQAPMGSEFAAVGSTEFRTAFGRSTSAQTPLLLAAEHLDRPQLGIRPGSAVRPVLLSLPSELAAQSLIGS